MLYEQQTVAQVKLGKARAISHPKQLFLDKYLRKTIKAPKKYDGWKRKAKFPVYNVGNTEFGNCTKASQALLAMRMERKEQRKTIIFPRESIVQSYFDLTAFHYGGGDTGAYELDALNSWRDANATFKDAKGRPHVIESFVRINHANIEEVKQAIVLSGAQGIKVCFQMPIAWIDKQNVWDIPDGQQLVGEWEPWSWGGHSMMAAATYDEEWLTLPSTWNMPDGKISWRAFAKYCDEAYVCIDSMNAWKKRAGRSIDINAIRTDVNKASRIKIE